MKAKGTPVALAVIMLGTLGVTLAIAIPREEEGGQAQPHSQPTSVPAATDDQIVMAIRGSDDLEQHRSALVAASRAFMAVGGTLADLREMGGRVGSSSSACA